MRETPTIQWENSKRAFEALAVAGFISTDAALLKKWRTSATEPKPVLGFDESTGGFIVTHAGHSLQALRDELPAA